MTKEQAVSAHYTKGDLLSRIEDGLEQLGHAIPLSPDILAPVDEFHIGGRPATEALISRLDLVAGQKVLDLGCGLGGPARFTAAQHAVHVTGVDLTREFVETGQKLNEMTALQDRVALIQGSILDLPFPTDHFDAAYMIHVGMNIADKDAIAVEAARVLKPGALFAIYDAMQVGKGAMTYPVPWASSEEQSALAPPGVYRTALEAAGFSVVAEQDRSERARAFFARLAANAAAAVGPPPLSLNVVMGSDASEKIQNMVEAVGDGRIAPVEILARLTA